MRDVCFSCDDNGAKFLRVTVWSLLKHYSGNEPMRINVFEGFGGHSAESKAKLQAIVEGFGATLRYHNVEQAIEPYADLIMNREKSRWNVFTWAPIFTPLRCNFHDRPYRKLYHEAMLAVGQTPPKEPLLAPYYDWTNWINLWKISRKGKEVGYYSNKPEK